jgi:outer membrane protein
MKNKILIAIFALVALANTEVQAQTKIGFINVDYILSQLPEFKQVETEIRSTQQQYENMLQQKVKDFQAKVADYEKNSATMADPIRIDRENTLKTEQQSIEDFRTNSSTSLQKKQAQLLQPLLKKIEDNMHTVAKENGFAYVFNSDAGAGTSPILLHAPDDANMSDLVLKKMGVTPKPIAAPVATPATTTPKKN